MKDYEFAADVPASAAGVSDGAERWQLEREAAQSPGPIDDPGFLLWHFALNSREPGVMAIDRTLWLKYARTLRRVLGELEQLKTERKSI